ncbi:MAG TPA: sodium/proton-translocating pyrophosphatase, partial [Kiritimatiellia bacterium]|nr:sodium/proton-translocating pyrophosphatase [Kiritimatiellia bacterium]
MLNEIVIGCGLVGVAALGFALYRGGWVKRQDAGNERLQSISAAIREGAMAFLSREYKILVVFVIVVSAALAIFSTGSAKLVALSFATGAICSALAGFFGMRVATLANGRTAHAAQEGLGAALKIAFNGGSVMGMSVVGLAIVGLTSLLLVYTRLWGVDLEAVKSQVLPVLAGFSLGASSIALFARVGGGIYTKAADVGADLVGKVESGMNEDDERNPATIADNVGDNVGDV